MALSAAGVMLLAACGDDDGGSDDAGDGDGRSQEYVEAASASLREDGEFPVDAERADCVAAAMVDVVGVDTLTDAGISPEEFGDADNLESLDVDLPDDAVDRLGNAVAECDLVGFFEDVVIDGFSREVGTELSSEAAACLRDSFDERALADAVARTFVDGSSEHVQEPAVSALAACPPALTEVLLAQASSDLPPAAETCLSDFMEDNADLMAQLAAGGGSREARQEAGARLTAACPDVAAALGG
jgi:hypothetical protein